MNERRTVDRMGDIEQWLKTDDARGAVADAFAATGTPLDGNLGATILEHLRDAAHSADRGAVSAAASIAEELRALGQEWREEWPDGRVCKASLNKIADHLAALGGQSG